MLDPFGGGGNLIFEARRLGLDCSVNDYNPLSYLIMKCTLEYPPKYGINLVSDVEKYGKLLIDLTKKELEIFFKRDGRKSLAYLWVWCIVCPYCKQRVPLLNQMWILKTSEKKIGLRFSLNDDLTFKTELVKEMSQSEGDSFTQRQGKAICIRCRNSIGYAHLTKDIAERKDREMIAVIVDNNKTKDYEVPTKKDNEYYELSIKYLQNNWDNYHTQNFIPVEYIRASHQNTLWHYGIKQWYQFFSERQLLVMLTLLKNIKEVCRDIVEKEYSKVISTYLSFILCKHIARNSIGIGWQPESQKIRDALAFRRPGMVYNHAEVNPFEKISGGLYGMLDDITKAINFSVKNPNVTCKITLESALRLPSYNDKFDLIVTDPPYLDDVQYGELSDFFYVWIYRAIKDYYAELPALSPLEEDISVSRERFGKNLQLATTFYNKALGEAFKKISSILKDDGLIVIFFSHSSTEAWNLLLNVLRNAKLRVVSSYAIHTENVFSIMARGKTSFMSSIVISCRKILSDSSTYFEELLPSIENKVKYVIKNLTLEQLLELPMTDLLIMTYGKVLEETTQHTLLKSYRSDFTPEFDNLIKDAREFILKEIVTKLTGRTTNLLGSDMSFYIITKAFYRGILDSNEALKIAWAYSLNIQDLENRGVAKKETGITRLNFYDEVNLDLKTDEIDKTNLHQQLLYLESIANREGVVGVKRLVSQYNNFRVQDLKQIISLLIKSYRSRLNKKEILNGKELKELEIIEGLGDVFNSSTLSRANSLEKFM